MQKLPVLTSAHQFCTECPDQPPVHFENREDEKEPLTIYGVNGSYQVFTFVLVLHIYSKDDQAVVGITLDYVPKLCAHQTVM